MLKKIETNQSSARKSSPRGGFTLMEVLLVLAIIGVIAGMVVPQLMGKQEDAMIDAAKNSMHGIETSLKLYATDHDGKYPEGNQEILDKLVNPTDSNGKQMTPYLDKINDPWDNKFYYRYPGTHNTAKTKVDLWSSGPNGRNEDGSGDDINNWSDDK